MPPIRLHMCGPGSSLGTHVPGSGPQTPSGSLENRLDALGLAGDVVRGGRRAGRRIRARQGRGATKRVDERLAVGGIDEHARFTRHEFRRAAHRGPDDGALARHRLEQRLTERLDEARLTEHIAGGQPLRHPVVGHPAHDSHPLAPLELWTETPVTHEGEAALGEALERVREAQDVLAPVKAADAEEGGAVDVPAERRSSRARVCTAKAFEVDAAVHDLDPPARLGHPCDELAAQIVGDRDHGRRPPHHDSSGRAHTRHRAHVPNVAPVRGDDERRAPGERDQPGRNEEMRVDDIRAEASGCSARTTCEPQILRRATSTTVDDGRLDDMAPPLERLGKLSYEDPVVGVGRARPHG